MKVQTQEKQIAITESIYTMELKGRSTLGIFLGALV